MIVLDSGMPNFQDMYSSANLVGFPLTLYQARAASGVSGIAESSQKLQEITLAGTLLFLSGSGSRCRVSVMLMARVPCCASNGFPLSRCTPAPIRIMGNSLPKTALLMALYQSKIRKPRWSSLLAGVWYGRVAGQLSGPPAPQVIDLSSVQA